MSEQIKFIKEILNYIEEYQKTTEKIDINGFSYFLNNQVLQKKILHESGKTKNEFDKNNYNNYKMYSEVEFSTLLTNLYRFAKNYMKKAFKTTEIKTVDEFGFLASLLRQKSLLKKDLINQHLLETSSGSEILKRLQAKNLIDEKTFNEDKRAKLVFLTEKGIKTILNSFDEMHKVSEIIIGNLSEEELKQSLIIFNKLNDFHKNIQYTNKKSSISEIHSKHIKKNDS